jgi:undecaprenyl-diphosphatase
MTWINAIILGLVEGLTEFLPVSSTGHLILAQRLMGIGQSAESSDAAGAYAICIQAGAILAVAGLYFRRLRQVARGCLGGNPAGRALGFNLLVAFLPAMAMGLAAGPWIKNHLFGGGAWGLWPIIAAWFAGGLAILVMSRWIHAHRDSPRRALESMSWKMALVIGLAQCLAMWPGVSRSLATLLGGLWAGLSLPAAVEFSFLLGLITLGASTAYDAIKSGDLIIAQYGWITPLIGLVTALVSATLAIQWMVHYLRRHPLVIFGYYRILLALATLLLVVR